MATRPLMLSELIEAAVKAMIEHGDVPVGVETCVPGYEHNEEHSLPVMVVPNVREPVWTDSYWIGRYDKAFCIEGG